MALHWMLLLALYRIEIASAIAMYKGAAPSGNALALALMFVIVIVFVWVLVLVLVAGKIE
jgi:hypothetical protein